ncbi:hypothetical protein [Gemella haemolysans]|uniref:hypothetical protein n=1 Tax=Gemella haemolysans TaxID=1379 RepID=UPI0028D1F1ED|nr:hypothetical protein [Gemella haemolysans]
MENLFVKAEGPSQPTTPAGTTPSVLSKDVDISTGKEAGGAENNTIDRAEAKYNKLKSEYKKGDALVNHKPEYKLPAATQTPKKHVNPMNKKR